MVENLANLREHRKMSPFSSLASKTPSEGLSCGREKSRFDNASGSTNVTNITKVRANSRHHHHKHHKHHDHHDHHDHHHHHHHLNSDESAAKKECRCITRAGNPNGIYRHLNHPQLGLTNLIETG